MNQNTKYREIILLKKIWKKSFDEPDFVPYENYGNIFNDISLKLTQKDKDFMKEYHNVISKATGIKCGLSENENENNPLNILKDENNMVENPIRVII